MVLYRGVIVTLVGIYVAVGCVKLARVRQLVRLFCTSVVFNL